MGPISISGQGNTRGASPVGQPGRPWWGWSRCGGQQRCRERSGCSSGPRRCAAARTTLSDGGWQEDTTSLWLSAEASGFKKVHRVPESFTLPANDSEQLASVVVGVQDFRFGLCGQDRHHIFKRGETRLLVQIGDETHTTGKNLQTYLPWCWYSFRL